MRFIFAFFAIAILLSFMTADPAHSAEKMRGYTGGRFSVDVGHENAGWLNDTEGGHATSEEVPARNTHTIKPATNARPVVQGPITTTHAVNANLKPVCAHPPCPAVIASTPPHHKKKKHHTGLGVQDAHDNNNTAGDKNQPDGHH